MNKHFLLPLLICGAALAEPASAGVSETFGPMTVTVPSDWRKRTQPDGTIAFAMGAAGAKEECEVFFSSGDNPGLTESAAHQGIWAQLLSQVDPPEKQESGASGRFNWTETAAFNRKDKRREWYRLYTTKEGATLIGIIVGASAERLFNSGVDAVEDLLANAKFAGAADAAAASASQASAPANARDANDVPIVESQVHIQIQPNSLTSSVLTDHILFFENGIVVRTGVIDGPRECYAALPVANLATLPFNYGRWREDKAARAIDVDWQEGPAWHLAREGDKREKLSLNGKRLLKLRPVDGAKLDGTYVYRSGNDVTALAFAADSGFETLNLTESMTCGGAMVANGSGTYEVRKWTLILHFSNGTTSMLPITIRDEENLQRVKKFSVKHYEFRR